MERRHPGSTHTNTQIRKQQCFRATPSVLQEQSMCGEGSGTPGETRVMEGEKERGIAQGGIMLVWPVSRPPVLEHEKEQVVYTPVKKSHHIHSSTWMLFRLMDSGLLNSNQLGGACRCFICHLSPTLTHTFLPLSTTSYLLPLFAFISLSPPHPMCLFDFAESCVMTKPSLPGCMRSAPVSCPSEAWGPSRAHSSTGLYFPGREEGPWGGGGWVIAAHTLSCLLMQGDPPNP